MDRIDELYNVFERIQQYDEETQNEILQNAVDKMYSDEYGEARQDAEKRKKALLREKENHGREFPLLGTQIILTKEDRAFYSYYLKCYDEGNTAIENAVKAFQNCVKDAVVKQSADDGFIRKTIEFIGDLGTIGIGVSNILWECVLENRVYVLKKEELKKKLLEAWWGMLAGIDAFFLADMYYDYRYDNGNLDHDQIFLWMQELRKNMKEIDDIRKEIEICYQCFVVETAKYVNKYGVLLNTYEYSDYKTIRDNIISDGVNEENVDIFIDNMNKFPVSLVDYITLALYFGDNKHEILNIMLYLGGEERYKRGLLHLLDTKVPEIKKISNFSKAKYSEAQLLEFKRTVESWIDFFGLKGEDVDYYVAITQQLKEIDIMLRTVKGNLFETREEAARVRKDYILLQQMINDIDFEAFDLFDEDMIASLKNNLFNASYGSDAFQNNKDYIAREFEPVLKYRILLQKWTEKLHNGKEPWKVVPEIILNSELSSDLKEKFKYWNFDGLKKYYPTLMQSEKPVLFYQCSLFGWSNYFVLTNKRVLRVEKNEQSAIMLSDKMTVEYRNGQLVFGQEKMSICLVIPMKCQENCVGKLSDIMILLTHTLCKCDETLFESLTLSAPETVNAPIKEELLTSQLKGVFQNRFSPLFKGGQKKYNESSKDTVHIEANENNTSAVRYCTQCGAQITDSARFCQNCGAKL